MGRTASHLLSLLQNPKMTTARYLLPEDELTHRRPHPATSPKISTDSVNDHLKPTDKGHTLTWDEIPDWRRDNEYITGGYRRYVSYRYHPAITFGKMSFYSHQYDRLQYSFQGCFHSVFACTSFQSCGQAELIVDTRLESFRRPA